MSEHNNLEIVKSVYAAHRQRDLPALLNCLASNVKWLSIGPPDKSSTAGGDHEQIEKYFASLTGAEGEDFEPREFIVTGNKVIAIGDFRQHALSTASLTPLIHVFTLDKGKITEFRWFYDVAVAVAALEEATPQAATRLRPQSLRRSFL